MRLRTIAVTGILATTTVVGGMTAVTLAGQPPAHASGSTVSTSTTTKVMVNSRCYEQYTRTVTTYQHKTGHGWVRYVSPRVTTSKSEHCYAS